MKKNKPNIVNFDAIPTWFPQTAFNDYIHDYLYIKNPTNLQEQLFFEDLVNRLNQLPFIKQFQIYRKYMKYFKLLSSIHATASSHKILLHNQFNVNVNQYGFDFKFGESFNLNTFECLISYYLFKSGSIGFQYSRPLIKYPNFQNKIIFPFFTMKCNYDRREFYQQIIISNNFETSYINSNNSFRLSFFANKFDYQLSPIHSSYFDKECYPFSCLGVRSHHDFDSCSRLPFIRNANTQITLEPNLIIQKNDSFPMISFNSHTKIETIFNAIVHLESGLIISPRNVPLCKRFYVGGIPTMRGIRYNEFSSKIDDIPLGSNAYFAYGIDQSFSFYYDPRIRGHVFLNSGISHNNENATNRNQQSNFAYFMSYGAGLIFDIMGRTFEVNFAYPAYLSQNQKLMWFQIGIDKSRSIHE